ncbi:tRNA pseudouridine(38-40) synthase TruA [Gammaproteobacteria bacterium]|nr:tRNA pseudouridine(38-40) synthase TruA [Gammaproteobacteria bacterium]
MKSANKIRISMGVAYLGVRYSGFQFQPDLETVEGKLLLALEKIAGESLKIHCAGRTDKGVHALCQVIHIDTAVHREMDAWVKGANALLPNDIQLLWAKPVPQSFHARCGAKSRSYVYYLSDQKQHIFEHPYVWQVKPLNVELMHDVAQMLLGEHDFRAFQSKICQSSVSYRNMMQMSVKRQGRHIRVDLKANAFLHRMVRKIVASLVAVGQGRLSKSKLLEAFKAGNRAVIPGQAPARALFLSDVCYGEDILVEGLEGFLG